MVATLSTPKKLVGCSKSTDLGSILRWQSLQQLVEQKYGVCLVPLVVERVQPVCQSCFIVALLSASPLAIAVRRHAVTLHESVRIFLAHGHGEGPQFGDQTIGLILELRVGQLAISRFRGGNAAGFLFRRQ